MKSVVWRASVAAIAMALGASATLALAQDRIMQPDWLRKPSAEDMSIAWPTAAKSGGQARIKCKVTVQGTLRACEILSENPAGKGVGAAAIALTPQFLMRPQTDGGKPVEATVTIPITFKCETPQDGMHLKEDCGDVLVSGRKLLNGIVWRTAPSFDDVAAAYPQKARERKTGGIASLNCVINGQGGLGQCDVMSEEPQGLGFGSAARKLADKFSGPMNVAPDVKLNGVATRLTFVFDKGLLDGVRTIGKPRWTKAPTVAEALALYPEKAKAAKVMEGRASLRCKVGEGGALTNCAPAAETPADLGFGAAGVTLMSNFKLQTWTEEGLPVVGGDIRIPVVFQAPEASGQASSAAR